jgi:uroporphyrinogen decarboxylase
VATSREIIEAVMRRGQPERVGVFDTVWPDTLVSWVAQGYPTRRVEKQAGDKAWSPEDGRWREVERAGEFVEPVPEWEHFGWDMVGCGGWFDAMPRYGYDELVEDGGEWEVRRNGAGAALKFWKHKSGTPEHIGFLMNSRETWEHDYRPFITAWNPARVDLETPRLMLPSARSRQAWSFFGHMFIWELMRQSMGDVTLYENLLLDPGWIRDFGRVYTDFYQRCYRLLFEEAGLPDGIWMYEDLGYKNGLFASPRVLERLIFPFFREMVEFFHSYNLPVVLHSCGSVAKALPMIVEAGFDALNPMERKADGNDPYLFAEKYGDRLAFVGGLDARVLETNDHQIIQEAVVAYVEGMKTRGARLVFATDHSISPLTRYDTYRYALDVYRRHMQY